MGTVAEAFSRQGRSFHPEMDLPVYLALQGFATAVQQYEFQLRNGGIISQNASIRTHTAGNSLLDAESAWANSAEYVGRRMKRRSSEKEDEVRGAQGRPDRH